MKTTLKDNKAAEIIIANYYKNIYGNEYAADQIADMLRMDFGLEAGAGKLGKNIDKDETINEVVEYICRYILGQNEGPWTVSCDLFDAFLGLELGLERETEDYEDEAAWMRCEDMRLARL